MNQENKLKFCHGFSLKYSLVLYKFIMMFERMKSAIGLNWYDIRLK